MSNKRKRADSSEWEDINNDTKNLENLNYITEYI